MFSYGRRPRSFKQTRRRARRRRGSRFANHRRRRRRREGWLLSPVTYVISAMFSNHNRGARLISNEPRPRTFYLGGSYEVLHGVLCGLARRRSPRPDEFTTRDQAIKAWWSWS